jgi:MSHA biogenesis protein MshI
VYVVAAEQWQVDEQAAIVSGGRRLLDNIDIPELALRNLMRLAPGEANGCALLLLGRGYLQILISRNGCLYLARRIEGALARDPGQIALEVQRSLQFHETHFDAPAVGRLLLTPASAAADSLARSLADATGLTVELLPVEQMLDCSGIDLAINEPESIIALGAALRPMQVELN